MSDRHLTTLALSAQALGSSSDSERKVAVAHLAVCERCRALAAEMQEARDRFASNVFARTLPALQARSGAGWWSSGGWRLRWLAPAGALTVTLMAVVVSLHRQPRADYSIKGAPTLQVFARRGAQVFAVRDGETLAAGDQLRFAVEPGDFGYLLIASVDGAGRPSVYYPFDGRESGTITPQSRSELPGSVVLDATPGDERLFAVFSREPLASQTVLEKVQSGASLPGGVESVVIRLHKGAP